MPFLAQTAHPPDDLSADVLRASSNVEFQPRPLACLLASPIFPSPSSLVSWMPIMSADETFSTFVLAEVHELALTLSMAHHPWRTHHLSSSMLASSQTYGVPVVLLAIPFLDFLRTRFPSLSRSLCTRLVGPPAASSGSGRASRPPSLAAAAVGLVSL